MNHVLRSLLRDHRALAAEAAARATARRTARRKALASPRATPVAMRQILFFLQVYTRNVSCKGTNLTTSLVVENVLHTRGQSEL